MPRTGAWAPQALVLAPLGALLAWWALDDGGYDPEAWQAGTVVLLGMVLVALSAPVLRRRHRPSRALLVALGAFAAYTAWSYASIAWADAPGTALEGAHRCTLYLATMVLMALVAPSPAVLRGAAVAVAAIIGVAAAVTVLRIDGAAGPAGLFLNGRLFAPMGYFNADAALWTTGALLGCVLASQRETPGWLRPPLLALAPVELGLATMTGSRGWLFTLPVVAVLVLLLVPGRLRFALAALIAGAGLLPIVDRLLKPGRAGGGRSAAEGVGDGVRAAGDALGPLLLVAVGVLVVAATWVLLDRRIELSAGTARTVRRASAVVAALAVAGGAAAGLALEPHPGDRVERAWTDFKADAPASAGRFSSTGSSRYDFWRVAVDLTARHPVRGIGQDNFAQPYVARRALDYEEPRWVHSLPLRALTHTGIVGAALLAVALGALVAGWLAKRGRPAERGVAALALVPLVPWVVHGSVDWIWEFPVLSVAALGLAAGAGVVPVAAAQEAVRAGRWRRGGVVAAAVVAAAGIVVVGGSWVASRDIRLAARGWPADPPAAFERLEQAAALTPGARPQLIEATIALRLGDRERGRRALEVAADREPGDWYAPFQLGLLRAEDGDRPGARRLLADAAGRNPKDPVLQEARREIARGRPFTWRDAERLLGERRTKRFGTR